MNIKNIAWLLALSCLPIATYSMMPENSPEQNFLNREITHQQYLNLIMNGLYGQDIAYKLKRIRKADYVSAQVQYPNKHIVNLYQRLTQFLDMALTENFYHTVESLRKLITIQIPLHYKQLQEYENKGYVAKDYTMGG